MGGSLEGIMAPISGYVFDAASLLIAVGALIYAARAFRVSKQALKSGEDAHLAELKMKALEGRARAERSFLSLQTDCHGMRERWDLHHREHFPKLSVRDLRPDDTHHIFEIEGEGRRLLASLKLEQPEIAKFEASDLENYIRKANNVAIRIEQLALRLSAPKSLFG
ncbi:hypothetical protein [Thioclava sp.]|uniref:hypothetical protein n=1 Tax=Thioclava sp. TaxID=1933450 RepID=UPI003AA805A1